MPKTIFIRKPVNLAEVKSGIEEWKRLFDSKGDDYYVAEELQLSNQEWERLTESFLDDRYCFRQFSEKKLTETEEGTPCIRVTCPSSEIALIVDTQGYDYARYVGIEPAELSNQGRRTWYDTEGKRVISEAELREEYESLPADQRKATTFDEYIRMGEEETLRRVSVAASSEIEDEPENEWDDEPTAGITEGVVEDALWGMLTGEWDVENSLLEGCRVQTYANAGVMTYNKGLVVSLPDGSEFQITIVQSR